MAPVKAGVRPKSDPRETLHREGNYLHQVLSTEFAASLRSSKAFSMGSVAHLRTLPAETQAAFIKGMISEARVAFTPWTMEVVFVLGLLRRARFTELQRLLGVSSRTLSDKLSVLREEGFLERQVFDEQPVRIEYFLTKRGVRVAALASPLFAELDCDDWKKDQPRASGR